MIKEGFKKVAQSGGSYVVARFFNPETLEEYTHTVRDYDYDDCRNDDDEAYYEPIDEEARKVWFRAHGWVRIGDTVKVVKGRKVPIGTVGVVKDMFDWRDCYGRIQCTYVRFEDGRKTNVDNVVLV